MVMAKLYSSQNARHNVDSYNEHLFIINETIRHLKLLTWSSTTSRKITLQCHINYSASLYTPIRTDEDTGQSLRLAGTNNLTDSAPDNNIFVKSLRCIYR